MFEGTNTAATGGLVFLGEERDATEDQAGLVGNRIFGEGVHDRLLVVAFDGGALEFQTEADVNGSLEIDFVIVLGVDRIIGGRLAGLTRRVAAPLVPVASRNEAKPSPLPATRGSSPWVIARVKEKLAGELPNWAKPRPKVRRSAPNFVL